MATAAELLEKNGVKATSNRILVIRTLIESNSPMSLIELETALETLDRSSIQRVLTVLSANHLVHVMEDGRGVARYEVCHSSDHHIHDDHHAHFYCERCRKVYCLDGVGIPHIPVPEGFKVQGANFMLKGLCPGCGR